MLLVLAGRKSTSGWHKSGTKLNNSYLVDKAWSGDNPPTGALPQLRLSRSQHSRPITPFNAAEALTLYVQTMPPFELN